MNRLDVKKGMTFLKRAYNPGFFSAGHNTGVEVVEIGISAGAKGALNDTFLVREDGAYSIVSKETVEQTCKPRPRRASLAD
jgi:hypothetical protein